MPKRLLECSCHLFMGILCLTATAETMDVTDTGDSGDGSLRAAITEANENAGADTILFNIPPSDDGYNNSTGTWTIQPLTSLPQLTDDGTFIYAGSQTVNQGDTNIDGPEIVLDGSLVNGNGISVGSNHNIIQGLAIHGFSSSGVLFDAADSNTVRGNYLGVDATGTLGWPNYTGIELIFGAEQNLIGGNRPEDRNVISGNHTYGIYMADTGTDGNKIRGNYIGTNAAGDDTLGNRLSAIRIAGGPSGNRIGGVIPEQRNIIAGANHPGNVYSGNGITITNSNGNIIIGNYIGTDKTGTVALPNLDYGILIKECESTMVGGTADGRSNVISGNGRAGVFLRSVTTIDNTVSGNLIGTDFSGLAPLGNGTDGVLLDYGAHDNIIGPGNIIAYNDNYGIRSEHDSTRANTITQNSIHDHQYDGIRLNGGANDTLSPPIFTDVSEAEIRGIAGPGCIVEIFSDEDDEGAIYEGFSMTDETGEFTWSGILTGPVITATATDSTGNTSEFSEPYNLGIDDYDGVVNPTNRVLSNYPNPFCTTTRFSYHVPRDGHVRLMISDPGGRAVATVVDRHHTSGSHTAVWDGSLSTGDRAPNGMYFYTMSIDDQTMTRRLVFLRP